MQDCYAVHAITSFEAVAAETKHNRAHLMNCPTRLESRGEAADKGRGPLGRRDQGGEGLLVQGDGVLGGLRTELVGRRWIGCLDETSRVQGKRSFVFRGRSAQALKHHAGLVQIRSVEFLPLPPTLDQAQPSRDEHLERRTFASLPAPLACSIWAIRF